MKKSLFYIFIILSIILFADIAGIILFDMDRLTRYGWGYLTGRILLLALFVFLAVFMFKKTYGKTGE
ncbi:MAG TPA: hypothetical protein VEA37_12730 [Flavobacterium sp.]|nr:hypothetical protein [Flavobacterium sp.]